jgi:hypothetical protein
MKKMIKWLKRHNEFTFVLALIALIWYGAPPLLKIIDPQAGAFGIEMLYVPLLAGLFFFIALLFIWLYLKLIFPRAFQLLDNLFDDPEKYTVWEKSSLLLRFFGWLVVLLVGALLAVTGMSAIM